MLHMFANMRKPFFKGSTLKEKNLLPKEQTLSIKKMNPTERGGGGGGGGGGGVNRFLILAVKLNMAYACKKKQEICRKRCRTC